MANLVPCAVIAYLFLVLLAQSLSIETIVFGKRGNTYGSRLNLPLLKKKRTLNLSAFHQILTVPIHN